MTEKKLTEMTGVGLSRALDWKASWADTLATLRDRIVAEVRAERPVALTEAEAERIAASVYEDDPTFPWRALPKPSRDNLVQYVLAGAASVTRSTPSSMELHDAILAGLRKWDGDPNGWYPTGKILTAVDEVEALLASPGPQLTRKLSGDRVVTAKWDEKCKKWRVRIANSAGEWNCVQYGLARTAEDAEALISLDKQMRETQ